MSNKSRQLEFSYQHQDGAKTEQEILGAVYKLRQMHKLGLLGGDVMPEDANPGLPSGSKDNYLYFTLPMALNYQRNSYTLWRSSAQMYADEETRFAFNPLEVFHVDFATLQHALTKYKVALQPNKHTTTWQRISETLYKYSEGDVRNLFRECEWKIPNILKYIQIDHKKEFPYLSGAKICNYWLYVISQYTDANLAEKNCLSVAPDTHVIQASIKLGLVSQDKQDDPEIQKIVSESWVNLLRDTELSPIDVHTPLWLWSRGGFIPII